MSRSNIHHLVIKNQKSISGVQVPHQEIGVKSPTQGNSAHRRRPHNMWLWKPVEDCMGQKLDQDTLFLKGQSTLVYKLTLSSKAGAAAQNVPGTHGKDLNLVTSE